MKRITAHVELGHPNGQRTRAGITFGVVPADYDVTDEQLRAIKADTAIVVTRVTKPAEAPKAEEKAAPAPSEKPAEAPKAEEKAAPKTSRRSQAQTAREQQAKDKAK